MRIRLSFVGIGMLVCARILSAGVFTSAQSGAPEQGAAAPVPAHSPAQGREATAPETGKDAKIPKDTCLGCHGPFDTIIEASNKYVAPSGEKTSPHRYIPHTSKKDEDVPECTNCHTAHSIEALPEAGSIDLSKVTVDWCYECHHPKDFTTCSSCH